MLKIQRWSGGLGNNIIQLINLLHIALYYNYSISVPSHKIIDTSKINRNTNKENQPVITAQGDFFDASKVKNISDEAQTNNYEEVIHMIGNSLKIKEIPVRGENELVIHIRSGDIFKSNPHGNYVMPPLSYQTNIIDENNFGKIILIAEDTQNPVISKLLELYPSIQYKKQSLEDDIQLLLATKNLVESFGTFTATLLLFSKNIKNIWRPSQQITCGKELKNVEVHRIDLQEQHSQQFPWKNNTSQRERLLTYNK